MGKVVKAVAVIAVAAAIAYFAPGLAPSFLSMAFGTAAATSITAAVLTMAAGMVFQALAPKPHSGTAPGRQPSRGQPMEQDGFTGWRFPPDPTVKAMPAVREPWWRDNVFWPWQRLAIVPIRGTCMVPVISAREKWVVLDRYADIHAGDVLLIRPDDLRAYIRSSGGGWWVSGLVKRFVGIDPDRRVAVYETTNPLNRIESGLDRIEHAYRVVSWHRTWLGAWRARRALLAADRFVQNGYRH